MVREEKTENKNSISEESKTFESIASEEKILLIDNISNKFIYIIIICDSLSKPWIIGWGNFLENF